MSGKANLLLKSKILLKSNTLRLKIYCTPKTVLLKASLSFLIQRKFLPWNNLTNYTFVVLKLVNTSLANLCRLEAKVFLTFATGFAANPANIYTLNKVIWKNPSWSNLTWHQWVFAYTSHGLRFYGPTQT